MRALLIAATIVAAACGAPAQSTPRATGTSVADARAVVLATAVTDVRSGEGFRLEQFKGKVVIALGIAAW